MLTPDGVYFKFDREIINDTDINKHYGSFNETMLHEVAVDGDVFFAQQLINEGALIDALDRHGYTPLHLAVLYNRESVVKLLIENGADVNIKTSISRTPLYGLKQSAASMCIEKDHEKLLKMILDNGGDLYSGGGFACEKLTLMHKAVLLPDENIANKYIQILLKYGADPTVKVSFREKNGRDGVWHNNITPSELALKKGYAVSYEYLKKPNEVTNSFRLVC